MGDERKTEEVHDTCEKACAILRATNDGDDLAPEHLKLIEMAVNGFVTEAGKKALDDLVEQCKTGYKKPWLHGIEHLTIDNEGFVFWKGHQVEHFNLGWHLSAEAGVQAAEVARRCRILEERGRPVNSATVVWSWKEEVKVGN